MSDENSTELHGNETVQWTAGIDWFTWWPEGREAEELAEEVYHEVRARDLSNGDKLRPFRFQGCEGWRTASIARGYGPLGSVLTSSSDAAASIVTQLVSSTGRMTRLDVQVTSRHPSTQSTFVRRAIRRSPATRLCPTRSRPRIGLSSASDGLAIGTVGRRTQPRYLRVYDKGVESRSAPAGTLWRLELEAKQDLARKLWDDFRTSKEPDRWCYARLEEQWKLSGCCWPLPSSGRAPEPLPATRSAVVPAHSLHAWLQQSVAPTMPRLLAVYSVTEVLRALGLSDLAMERPGASDHV